MGDYNYYLGSEDGKVYTYSGSYTSDDGQPISCSYYTKQLDFADQFPQYNNLFKTVYKTKLLFHDLSSDMTTTVAISTDGGSTWSYAQKIIGDGNSIPTSENFWMIKTGENFMFRITHSSDDKEFFWTGLEIDFLARGDYREL